MKISPWLDSFLHRRGVNTPDQRVLYEYHCSNDEFFELKHLLREFGENVSAWGAASSACFVLFCAEWYRREYRREHAWSWEPIWSSLDFRLSQAILGVAVPSGLEGFWKRPIHYYDSGSRDFLGSVFSEGGLPFQVLREGGSRFQSLFERLLKRYDQWHLLELTTNQQVEQQVEVSKLPQVFSTQTSVELIARMVDLLVELVRNFDLALADEPVARLDALNPRWREQFPLPLDSDTGTELLNGLLKTATVEGGKRRASSVLGCQHFWRKVQPDCLKVRVSLPEEQRFKLTSQVSTTRFDLAIVEDGQVIASLGPGYAVVNEGVALIRLRQREVVATRQQFSVPLRLVAMAGGVQVATTPIKESVVGVGEVPLGFEPVEDRWELRGQSSFNVSGEKLALMLPDGAKVTPVEPAEGVSIRDFCEAFSNPVVLVDGEVELVVETDETYRIRTGQNFGVGSGLDLIGSQLLWDTKPGLTFRGLPKTSFSGETEAAGELFIGGKRSGEGLLQESFGTQYVTVRSQKGVVLLRRKVGILPTDFDLELRSGDVPGQGSIFVRTHQRCWLQLGDGNVDVRQIRTDDCVELRMSSKGAPPLSVRLVVTPNLSANPIEITLPFPNSGCLAVDANDQQLSSDLCVDDLLGARLFLFGRVGASTRYNLELTLRGVAIARKVAFSWRYVVAETPLEISLYGLKDQIIDLLSLEEGIDQVVELRVSGNGQDLLLRIRRYAFEMQLDGYLQLVRAIGTTLIPQPILMLLHDPMRIPVELSARTSEGVATGGFSLPPLVDRDGPWLVLPKQGSSVSFRPLYLAGKMDPTQPGEKVGSLQKAVLSFDPKSPVSSFIPVLDAMSANTMHTGWQFLNSLYENYGYLPLATFAVWKALVGHDRALPMAFLRFGMNPQLLARIEAEFPIIWEFQHILEFRSVVKGYAESLQAKGVATEAIKRILSGMLSQLEEVFYAYGENIQRFLLGEPVGPAMSLPVSVFQSVVYDWYQELIRDRYDAHWPEFGGRRLEAWYREQGESVIAFAPEMTYRYAVVYFPVFAAAIASGRANLPLCQDSCRLGELAMIRQGAV